MDNVIRVGQQAANAKKIFDAFVNLSKLENEKDFRASFHLRPTVDGVTIVSTLKIAPMRGKEVKIDKLDMNLQKIVEVLKAPNDNKMLEIMDDLGFKQRQSEGRREEDVQAALIRELVLNKKNYNDMLFVASEFVLFEYEEKANQEKRPDVLAFKDGILYDIELKNERTLEVVTQASGYVDHIKNHLSTFNDCLCNFPNCQVGDIKDVKGIIIVPYSKSPKGLLEKDSKERGLELWTFNDDGNGELVFNQGKDAAL